MRPIRALVNAVDGAVEDAIGVGLLSIVFAVMVAAVFFRYVLNDSLIWAEELARYGFIALVYVGISTGYRRSSHVRIDLVEFMPRSVTRVTDVLVWLVSLAFLTFLLVQAVSITQVLRASRSASLEMPMAWLYWSVAVGIALGLARLLLIAASAARGRRGP
jgi:TRAP-type C4-dicarboxylate transport system permease small subunit